MSAATGYQRGLAILSFTVLAAGDFWRYLLSWWGWGALAGVLVVLAVVEVVRARVDVRRVPPTLTLFLGFAAASIIWSAYPGASALGVILTLATATVAMFLASCLDADELFEAFSTAMRWILGMSLLFEFVVAAIIRRPVLPLWVDYSDLEKIPAAFYWSRELLFAGGRIQGIVGNANILGMLALLALVVFVLRLAARRGSVLWGWVWIAVAIATLALTRSSTVIVAGIATALVGLFVWLLRRARESTRPILLISGGVLAVGLVAGAIIGRDVLLGLLGRSGDLTNRVDIWRTVAELVAERPVVGWGWVGYWNPFVEPFDDLIVIKGVTYLQAHNAWLDVLFQLGVIGLVIFAALVLGVLVRSWGIAVGDAPEGRARIGLDAAIPLLLLVAMLVQSLAESRLIIELGFALLVTLAVSTARSEHRARLER